MKLATHRATGTTCAVKILSKALVAMTRQARNVKSERELLLTLRHPLVLRCHGSFADEDRLYLVLELVTGGELAAVLKKRGTLDAADAAFYASCALLALGHCHGKRVMYQSCV